jgi:hypothetical protein
MKSFAARNSLSIALILVAAAFAACAKPNPNEVLLKQLEEKGFLKHAGANAETMRAAIRAKGWPGIFGESGRIFNADGLTLAKGGATKFMEKLRPFLESERVTMPAMSDDLKQESYTLVVDGARLPMWTKEDLSRELGSQPGITSALTAARSFALVNQLLERAGSQERAYAVYSGAALSVMFVTDDLLAIMKADANAVPKFMPYKLTSDFPFFGQPQQ